MTDARTEFWSSSKVASRYDRVVDVQFGGKTRQLVRARLGREAQLGSVAELGCGTGYFTGILAARSDHVVATDASPAMVELASERVLEPNVTFRVEDCQHTSFPDGAFDSVFLALVLHFTDPEQTIAEMHRVLKAGGLLIAVNLDPKALAGFDRLRARVRVLYEGICGYRTKPPKGLIRRVLSGHELCDLLVQSGFEVLEMDVIRDPSRSSNIPVEYVRAARPVQH